MKKKLTNIDRKKRTNCDRQIERKEQTGRNR